MSNRSGAPTIVETERLSVREIVEDDAPFIVEILNTPSFIEYIGDRGVRSIDDARRFIDTRYRQSYRDHGYGLYTVELRENLVPIGMCGFVRRGTLPGPDVGFAFLPNYEGQGYGYESASAMMKYGRSSLGFDKVFAITSLDNEKSGRLLIKLGFNLENLITMPDGEVLNLYSSVE